MHLRRFVGGSDLVPAQRVVFALTSIPDRADDALMADRPEQAWV